MTQVTRRSALLATAGISVLGMTAVAQATERPPEEITCAAWQGMVSHGWYTNYNVIIFDLPEGRLVVEHTSDGDSISKPRSAAPLAYFAVEDNKLKTYVKKERKIEVPRAFLETALAACAAQKQLADFDFFFKKKPKPV